MTFNAKAWLAAHEPPTYIAKDGTKQVGKLWSHLEYHKWRKVFLAWKDAPGTDEQYASELKAMICSMGFTDETVAEMIELPSVALEEMLRGFFVLQRKGADVSLPETSDSSTPAPLPPSPSSQTSPTTAPALTPSAS